MKLYRLMGILLMLENYNKMTAKQLAEHFEVSVRTIYRDLDALSIAGYDIVTESGTGGGIWLQNKGVKVNSLESDEMQKLVQMLALERSEDENLALRFRAQLPESAKQAFDKLSSRILRDEKDWYGRAQVTKGHLKCLQEAIVAQNKIRVDYDSYGNTSVDRILHPLGLCEKSGKWYLVAFCELREAYRTFMVGKFKALSVLDTCYAPHEAFDMSSYWATNTKNYNQRQPQPEDSSAMRYPVTLRCDRYTQAVLSAFNTVALETGEYCVDFVSESVAYQQLLPYCETATILAPEALVERFRLLGKLLTTKYPLTDR